MNFVQVLQKNPILQLIMLDILLLTKTSDPNLK